MNDSPRLPPGYEDNVQCTEDKNGRIVIHWPEGCKGTVISRELLDQMVEDKNNRPRWIPVEERLPTAGEEVLSFSENYGHVVARLDGGKWYAIYTDTETGEPWIRGEVTHWMPLPSPPDEAT